jgi:uncharacterized peroxidase-related enzyme
MPTTATHISAIPQPSSEAILDSIAEKIGFVPELFNTLAQQPGVVEAFVSLDTSFTDTSLTPIERQTILLAASVENRGRYCVAGHTLFGRSIGMQEQTINAIRSAGTVEDERLAALETFVQQLIRARGHTSAEEVAAFLQAGFSREQIMEVVMGITLKTFSNYVDSALELRLDEQFVAAAWSSTEESKLESS